MLKGKRITVLLPAYNEEHGLPKVVKKIPPFVDIVVVVDNNSRDKTSEVARNLGCSLIFEKRQGKGNAFKAFLKRLDTRKTDFVAMLDSDDTYDAREMEKVVSPLFQGFDAVMGDRLHGQMSKGSLTAANLFGNRLLTLAAKILYWFKLRDLCTGYWAFKAEKLKKLNIRAEGFDLEADLFSQSVKSRLRIAFVPIRYGKRAGEAKLRLRDGLFILSRLLYNRFF